MKTMSIASLLLTTALTFAVTGVASAQDKTVNDRRAVRSVRALRRPRRTGLDARRADGH
ncbi:hypothetical protein ACVWWR_006674 [Bradyrhizobium sp. LM3.2]